VSRITLCLIFLIGRHATWEKAAKKYEDTALAVNFAREWMRATNAAHKKNAFG
jgi:hypothetical protein